MKPSKFVLAAFFLALLPMIVLVNKRSSALDKSDRACAGTECANKGTEQETFLLLVEIDLRTLRFYFQPPQGRPSLALTNAIKAFQSKNGIAPSGILSSDEYGKLSDQAEQARFAEITIDPLYGSMTSGLPQVTRSSYKGEERIYAEGTWVVPEDSKDWPFNSTKITCLKSSGVCHEIIAFLAQPAPSILLPTRAFLYENRKTGGTHLYLVVEENSYDIVEWNADGVVANKIQMCGNQTVTIKRQPQEVILRDFPTPDCTPEILNDKRLNRVFSAKMIDGTTAKNNFYEKKAIEVRNYMGQ